MFTELVPKAPILGIWIVGLSMILGIVANLGIADELHKLTPANAFTGFGQAVGVSANNVLVGAPRTEIGGIGSLDGAVLVFDATTGGERFTLYNPFGYRGGQFGGSVDASGNTAIVGASFGGPVGTSSGSAYLFDVATGQHLFHLTASDGNEYDNFGISVGINAHAAIVGARGNDDAGESSGSAYLFDADPLSSTFGDELFKLTASDAAPAAQFGLSVDIYGSKAIVGAPSFGGSALAGAAYLFDVTSGDELFKLTASDGGAGDIFGGSVAIGEHVAVVGAWRIDNDAGAAYVFDVATGDELFKLTPADAEPGDAFGIRVAVDGNIAIVGAYGDDGRAGSAYLFDVTSGSELAKLTPSDAAAGAIFGNMVAIGGNTAVVGAPGDDKGAGAVYLFQVVPEPTSVVLLVACVLAINLPRVLSRSKQVMNQKSRQ